MTDRSIEWDRGERLLPLFLPDLTLTAFGEKAFGAVIPSGAADHWKAVAGWQWAGMATVEVISSGGGPAGLVKLTAKGMKQVAREARA